MNSSSIAITTLVVSLLAPAQADWNPQIYNAVKWTAANQGQLTLAFTTSEGITRVPMAYHGGVDTNSSGEITERNKEQFMNWVRENLPADYCGPVVMDYEQPWWKELSSKTISPERLHEILSIYIEGMSTAQQILPTAQWGYWGLPLLRHTGAVWKERGLSLQPLTLRCTALYPDIYDDSKGKPQTIRTKNHVTKVLEMAHGQVPVYVFASPRFTGEGGDRSQFVPDNVFLGQVNAAMQAVWIDENEVQHRIQGVIFWDTYGFTPESEWEALDQKHKYYFELLQALATAWNKSLVGAPVHDEQNGLTVCQFGLPEPRNSAETILSTKSFEERTPGQSLGENNRAVPTKENDRLPSGRIPSNRTNQ